MDPQKKVELVMGILHTIKKGQITIIKADGGARTDTIKGWLKDGNNFVGPENKTQLDNILAKVKPVKINRIKKNVVLRLWAKIRKPK